MPTVSGTVTDKSGNVASWSASWSDSGPIPPSDQVIIGMSAFPEVWDARLSEVGPTGIGARRIFSTALNTDPRDKESLIRQAIADGMIPVLSYKGTPTTANCQALRAFLVSLDTTVTATWAHEPHGDMTPTAFRSGSRIFLDNVQAPNVKVGPLLNGWLLDNLNATSRANWHEYSDAALLADWDFLGLDTYSEGTVAAPSSTLLCGRAIPKARAWLATVGHLDKPMVIGEYNGQITEAIEYAGQQIFADPNMWIACLWNMDHESPVGTLKFNKLVGARLTAFKETKADPRVVK